MGKHTTEGDLIFKKRGVQLVGTSPLVPSLVTNVLLLIWETLVHESNTSSNWSEK